MFKTHTYFALAASALMTGCYVIPEKSPQYTYSQTPVPVSAQPVNVSYNSGQTASIDPECSRRETNRELIGGAVGGTVGAYAGKKLIGGTTGLVAGAALGGAAGYGIGDISTNCAPAASPSYEPAASSNTVYQSAPTYSATQATSEPVSCPAGTTAHSSGTCMLTESNTSLRATTAQTTPAPSHTGFQQYTPAPRAANVIGASTAPSAPSLYRETDTTRAYSASGYRVKSGDTVYSLARKLCVPITAIQTSNSLDANYGIQIGQNLNLPASQC